MSQPSLFNNDPPSPPATGVKMEPSWKKVLADEFRQPYFTKLTQTLKAEQADGVTIYPPGSLIFNAFDQTPFAQVKVVILGQDPYHGRGQAHGLCFSVQKGIPQPPSLKNIFKELHDDLQMPIPNHGNLLSWAKQGVFLLNAILTVRAGKPASHRDIGWENFTNAAIYQLSEQREGLVFLLWGKFAQEKQVLINAQKHYTLTAPHPSPYSAKYGFFGCRHFSKVNEILEKQNKTPVNWQLG